MKKQDATTDQSSEGQQGAQSGDNNGLEHAAMRESTRKRRKSAAAIEHVKKVDSDLRNSNSKIIKKARGSIRGDVESIQKEWVDELCQRREKFPRIRLGAHVSAAGGPASAIVRAAEMGATAFSFFPRPHRTWNTKPLEEGEIIRFHELMNTCGYSPHDVVPHGSYLINCGSGNAEIRQKSLETLVEEVSRCQKLGVAYYNLHPGSATGGVGTDDAITLTAEALDYAIDRTEDVIILVETMCGNKNTIGVTFEEIGQILKTMRHKSRVGVCLDTCHCFAAGYDLSTDNGFEEMMVHFEKTIGRSYLRAIHLNDSKAELNSQIDRHEKLGQGKIGKAAFRNMFSTGCFETLPIILETPAGDRQDRRSEHSVEMDMLLSFLPQPAVAQN